MSASGSALRRPPANRSPIVLPKITQIRRRLVLHGGHQEAVAAEVINLLANADMNIAFAANLVAKPDRFAAGDASEGLVDHPWPGQRMVDGGDVVVQQVAIGLVEIDALLDDGLVVGMQRDSGGVIDARALHAASLDLKHVVAAVAVLIEPLADGITQE